MIEPKDLNDFMKSIGEVQMLRENFAQAYSKSWVNSSDGFIFLTEFKRAIAEALNECDKLMEKHDCIVFEEE
jgi:hypothetical protein